MCDDYLTNNIRRLLLQQTAKCQVISTSLIVLYNSQRVLKTFITLTIRYDTIEEINVDCGNLRLIHNSRPRRFTPDQKLDGVPLKISHKP